MGKCNRVDRETGFVCNATIWIFLLEKCAIDARFNRGRTTRNRSDKHTCTMNSTTSRWSSRKRWCPRIQKMGLPFTVWAGESRYLGLRGNWLVDLRTSNRVCSCLAYLQSLADIRGRSIHQKLRYHKGGVLTSRARILLRRSICRSIVGVTFCGRISNRSRIRVRVTTSRLMMGRLRGWWGILCCE